MNFFIKLIFLLLPIFSFCQNDAYDLLEKAENSMKSPEKALEYISMSEKLFLMSNNNMGLLEVENLRVKLYKRMGDKQNTYISLKELERLSLELNNIEKQLNAYKTIFEFFSELEMYDSALVYSEKIKILGEKHGLSEDKTNLNGYLGAFYLKLKKYDVSKEYLLKSIKLKGEQNKAGPYSDLGNNYFYMQMYDSALHYYTLAHENALKYNDTLGMAYTLNNIGLYYKVKKDYEKAIKYFNEAIFYDELIKNRYGIINSNSNIAQVYFLQGNYKKAIEICLTYYNEAKENEMLILQSELNKVLAESYENLKNYEKSITYYKELLDLKDTLSQSKFKMLSSDFDYKLRILQNQINFDSSNDSFWSNFCAISMSLNLILLLFIIYVIYKKNPHFRNYFSDNESS